MILALDIGNTRLKWGLHDSGSWREQGAFRLADVERLEEHLVDGPALAIFTNVAGTEFGARVRAIFERRAIAYREVVALREQCGVVNRYANPAQLGADRWAGLIGARAQYAAPALVVMAGTATTIDVLDGDGVFQGGLILPGFDLMRTSLSERTAQLKPEPGEFVDLPRATADAITSGCLCAQLGAVERMFHHLGDREDALCIVSGGASNLLYGHLALPKRLDPDLVLDGLATIALAA